MSVRAWSAACSASRDPADLTAVIIGHMHADHFLDLVALRYLFPWAEAAARPLPVYLPPGGRGRLDALATAISERAGFFDASFYARGVRPGRHGSPSVR